MTKTLIEIADLVMGQSPPGESCNTNGNGIPLLNGPTEYGEYHPAPVQFTTDPKKLAQSGDLLFCVRGSTTGRMNWADQQYAVGRGVAALRHRLGDEYQPFIRASIEYELPSLLAEATGSTFPNVSKYQLGSLSIHVDDTGVQREIGRLFGAIEQKIYLNHQINQTLESIAQTMFKSWFVDFDPVKAKLEGREPEGMDAETAALFPDSLVESEVGMIPEGWEAGSFGENSECTDSKRIPLSKQEREKRPGNYPYYGATSIMDYIDDYIFDGTYALMGEDGSVMKKDGSPFLQYVWGKIWVNNHAHVLRGVGAVSTEQLYLFLKTQNISPYITGAVQLKLNQKNMNSIPFIRATDDICEAFGTIIRPVFNLIKSNREEISTLTDIRDTLLPKLISGEIQIPTE